MQEIDLCSLCGVPRFISGAGAWESNGVLSSPFLPGGRGIFCECEAINGLFASLEGLLGLPIEHIIIESIRRDAREFMEGLLSSQISEALTFTKEQVRHDPGSDEAELVKVREKQKQWNLQAITVGRVYGFGDVHLDDGWDRGDRHPWRTQIIRNPFSISSYTAEAIGTVEAFEMKDMWADYELVGEDTYRISVYPQSHHAGLSKRLKVKDPGHAFKAGDINYKRCVGCNVPLEIARHNWNLEEGIITDRHTGRRMVFIPSASVEAILADLEAELGEEIPETVIEAQRRTMKILRGGEDWSRSGWTFKQRTGLGGMGNLVYFKATEHNLSLRIENSCMAPLMVGLSQALAELAYGVESSAREWSLSEDRDLSIVIKI
jgi:hypothetical protein